MDELYETAAKTLPLFKQTLSEIAKKANIDIADKNKFSIAPLKNKGRASEKAESDYSKRAPGPKESWLMDIVRGKIICTNGDEIESLINSLKNCSCTAIVRLKNRCKHPNFNGYRDFLINILFELPNGSHHICELQIHIKQILDMEHKVRSHLVYEYFRTYFNGNMDAVEKRLTLLMDENVRGTESNSPEEMVDRVIKENKLSDDTLREISDFVKHMGLLDQSMKIQNALVEKSKNAKGDEKIRRSAGHF